MVENIIDVVDDAELQEDVPIGSPMMSKLDVGQTAGRRTSQSMAMIIDEGRWP